MTAYKCDRCGKYYDLNENPKDSPFSNTFIRVIQRNNYGGFDVTGVKKELDLCENCTKELYKFLNEVNND